VDDRSWWRNGRQVNPAPRLDDIADDMELRQQPLPDQGDWEAAVRRAGILFAIHANQHRSVRNLGELDSRVRATAREQEGKAKELVRLLDDHADRLGLDRAQPTGRLATARAAARLLEDLANAVDGVALVRVLANAELPTTDVVLSSSIARGDRVNGALTRTSWELLDGLASVDDDREAEAHGVLASLQGAARHDEFEADLASALSEATRRAVAILAGPRSEPGPSQPRPPSPPSGKPGTEGDLLVDASRISEAFDALRACAQAHPHERIRVTWRVER
jgi:hypothetical protein